VSSEVKNATSKNSLKATSWKFVRSLAEKVGLPVALERVPWAALLTSVRAEAERLGKPLLRSRFLLEVTWVGKLW